MIWLALIALSLDPSPAAPARRTYPGGDPGVCREVGPADPAKPGRICPPPRLLLVPSPGNRAARPDDRARPRDQGRRGTHPGSGGLHGGRPEQGRRRVSEGPIPGGRVDPGGLCPVGLATRRPRARRDDRRPWPASCSGDGREGWRTTSRRPPSEASPFTSTYVALRGLRAFADPAASERVAERVARARDWPAPDPGRGHRGPRLPPPGPPRRRGGRGGRSARRRRGTRRHPATPMAAGLRPTTGEADAYATGTALVALHEAGRMATDDPRLSPRAGVPAPVATRGRLVARRQPESPLPDVLRVGIPPREGPVPLDGRHRMGPRPPWPRPCLKPRAGHNYSSRKNFW